MQTAGVCKAGADPVTCMDNMDGELLRVNGELLSFGAELSSLRSQVAASAPAGPLASAPKQTIQTVVKVCLGAKCGSQGPGSGEANGGGKRRRLQSFACASASALKARSRDVRSVCCPEGNCSEDMPTDCSLACATVRPPVPVQPGQQSSQSCIPLLPDRRQT